MPYNIAVCVKEMIDSIKIDPVTKQPVLKDSKLKLEDISRNAVEEAVRIKERVGGRIIAVMFASGETTVPIKEALAMGADEGILIKGYSGNDPWRTATVLAKKIIESQVDLVILGYASADSYTAQVPPRLARILGYPLLGNAIKVELDGKNIIITRAAEDYNIKLAAQLPAVVSVAQEINEPRVPLLVNIMAAARKRLQIEDAAIAPSAAPKQIKNEAPATFRKKVIFEDIDAGVMEIYKLIRGAS